MRQLIALTAVALLLAATAGATPDSATGGYGMSWSVSYQQLGDGTWEYGYDIFAEGHHVEYYDYFTMMFEFGDGSAVTDHISNLYDTGGVPELRDFWTVNGILGNGGGHWYWGAVQTGVQASYGDLGTDTWDQDPGQITADAERWLYDPVYAAGSGMDNPFHVPSDYAMWAGNGSTQGDAAYGLWAGQPGDLTVYGGSYYTPLANHLMFDMTWFIGGHMYNGTYGPELMATIRIVSEMGPYGEVSAQFYSSGTSGIGAIVAPGFSPADFDMDGDVDADDIDTLCANMGSVDLSTYDLDGSGVVDEGDFIFLIETYAEWDNGVGTYVGDFNLDGVVNATDLQIMKGSFGSSGVGYALGNANCDTFVNATDLQILKSTFGSAAAAVPEPLTIGLLAVGATALIRRKR